MRRFLLLALWVSAVMWWGFAASAQAYIDPATTSYLIQIVSAIIIGASVAIGVFFQRIRTFLVTARPRLTAWWSRTFTARGRAAASARRAGGGVEPGSPDLVEADLQAAVEAALGTGTGRRPAAEAGSSEAPRRLRLFGDDRSWLQRLPLAAMASFGVALPFLASGPMELYAANMAELPFALGSLLRAAIPAALLLGTAATILVSLLRGHVFDVAVSLMVGVSVASWLQSMFLNINTGTFIGDQFRWNEHLGATLLNLLLWVILIAAPLVLRVLHRRAWRWVALVLPGVIIVAGLISGLVAVVRSPAVVPGESSERYISREGLDQVSSTNNIIVFLTDATDQSVIRALEADPTWSFGALDGFTSFDQASARYQETFPALPYLWTGQDYLWDQPRSQYFADGYATSSFFPDLKAMGFDIDIYTTQDVLYWSDTDIAGLVDNLSPANPEVNHVSLMRGMARLTAFGRSPLALQPALWLDPDAFSGVLRATAGVAPPYTIDDTALWYEVMNNQLEVGSAAPRFTFIHLWGSHQPFILNSQAQPVPESETNRLEQTKGAFNLIYMYLDQLRSLGLYDSSTILIMADHGTHLPWEQRELDAPLLPCLLVKPAGAANTPLAHSMAPVSMENWRATIIEAAGGDPGPYGKTYWQVGQDETVEPRRFYWIRPRILDYDGILETFDIDGNALDFRNWRRLADIPQNPGFDR